MSSSSASFPCDHCWIGSCDCSYKHKFWDANRRFTFICTILEIQVDHPLCSDIIKILEEKEAGKEEIKKKALENDKNKSWKLRSSNLNVKDKNER